MAMKMRNFFRSREVILSAVFAVLLIAPFIVLGDNNVIIVDKDNKGSEDGSADHPYRSLGKALKNAKPGTEVHVRTGTYKENITIPKDVKVIGRKKDIGDVVIQADTDKKPAVTMKNDSEIDHLTVKGGKHGIQVVEDAEATIYDVVVKDSEGDGIHIDSGSREKKYQVVVSESKAKDNDKAGIYVGKKRNVVIVDSEVKENKKDGLDISEGGKVWVNDNNIAQNLGSGVKVWLDGAEVTLKDNKVRHNKREGVEINASGKAGSVSFKKMSISGNGRYGVAQVARTAAALKSFGFVHFDAGVNANHFEKNGTGSISSIIRGF
jgi:hypothetical protein